MHDKHLEPTESRYVVSKRRKKSLYRGSRRRMERTFNLSSILQYIVYLGAISVEGSIGEGVLGGGQGDI